MDGSKGVKSISDGRVKVVQIIFEIRSGSVDRVKSKRKIRGKTFMVQFVVDAAIP